MVNFNGYGNMSGIPANKHYEGGNKRVGKHGEHGKSNTIKDSSAHHTDVADFSSVMKDQKTDTGMKIGQANEKASGLSQTAKDYLEKLKKKYGNMDFIVADFSSDEEADKLLAKGKGEYNVLLTPDLLEKMAADEETAAKYEGIIESSVNDIKQAKEDLGEDADMVEKFGVSVDGDGNVTYHAKIIDALTNNKDGGKSVIKANTLDELLDNLRAAKTEYAEKLAKIREEKAAAAKKEAEALEDKKNNVEDKSQEMAEYTSFSAEA